MTAYVSYIFEDKGMTCHSILKGTGNLEAVFPVLENIPVLLFPSYRSKKENLRELYGLR